MESGLIFNEYISLPWTSLCDRLDVNSFDAVQIAINQCQAEAYFGILLQYHLEPRPLTALRGIVLRAGLSQAITWTFCKMQLRFINDSFKRKSLMNFIVKSAFRDHRTIISVVLD